MRRSLLATIALSFTFLLTVPYVVAKVPEAVLEQKNAIVTIYVADKNGTPIALGRGLIVNQDGVIVTNCHLVTKWLEEVENTLSVKMEGDVSFPIEYLLFSKCKNNIAIFTIEAEGLPTAKYIRDYQLRPGEGVFIIETPSEPESTILEGVIMDIHRKDKLIQISIPILKEQSGSPVFNINGKVIGIATSLVKKGENLTFAVPLRDIKKQIERYKKLKKKIMQSSKVDSSPALSIPSPKPLSVIDIKLFNAKKEVEENPNDPDALFLLGCVYDELNMYREAVEAYQQSLEVVPDFVEAYISIATAYYKAGKYDDVIDTYEQAILIEPDSPLIYNKIGGTYLIKGEYSMALDAFKKAVDLDPKNADIHFNLGIAYFLKGETLAAFREYKILKDLDEERANRLIEIMYY